MRMLFGNFLIQTPVYNWFRVRWKSKNKHHTNTCFNFLDYLLIFTEHSTIYSELNQKDLCIQLKNQQTCISKNQGRFDFQYDLCRYFIIDLLTKHKCEDINLINGQWGTREPAYLLLMVPKCICKPKYDSQWSLHSIGLWVRLFFLVIYTGITFKTLN